MTADVTSTLAHRAVANALWPALRANRWSRHRQTRDLGQDGSAPPFRSIATAHIPNAARAYDQHVITDQRYIRACIWADEWPGGTNLLIELTQDAYLLTLNALTRDVVIDYQNALHLATTRTPFEATTNRHGNPTLRRNSSDPWITAPAALALELIAANANVRTVPQHTVDDALITDNDINLASLDDLWKQVQPAAVAE